MSILFTYILFYDIFKHIEKNGDSMLEFHNDWDIVLNNEINNFSKSYGDKKAVDNISFKVESGDICAFVGPNGAGKTTTLKSACGILDFESGDIKVNSLSIKTNPIECKKIMAYLPDNPDLYEFLKGIDYLNFIADIYEVDEHVRRPML